MFLASFFVGFISFLTWTGRRQLFGFDAFAILATSDQPLIVCDQGREKVFSQSGCDHQNHIIRIECQVVAAGQLFLHPDVFTRFRHRMVGDVVSDE
jgi:hypothetical protein